MTSSRDISEQELMDYLSGSLSSARCLEIDDLLGTDMELAERVELLQRVTDQDVVSDSWSSEANEIRKMVAVTCRSKQFLGLRDDIRAGRVAVFVGPAVSRAAGLAGNADVQDALARKLARRLNAEDPPSIERLKHLGLKSLSELFVFHFGRPQMVQVIKEALYRNRQVSELELRLQELILEVPFALVVSTTWDDLFEELDPAFALNPSCSTSRANRRRPCAKARHFAVRGPSVPLAGNRGSEMVHR